MTVITTLFAALQELERLESAARLLHNTVCGPGSHIHETQGSALNEEMAWGIRETIYREIGQIVAENPSLLTKKARA